MQHSKLIVIFALLTLPLITNAASMDHTASEIGPNTAQGDFAFEHPGELYVGLKNTEASGRYWALVSAGSVGGIGAGKFSIYDKIADASRLVIDVNGNVGIGTASPGAKLDIAGNVRIADGTQGSGKVLISDAAGVASWQTPGGSIITKKLASDVFLDVGHAMDIDPSLKVDISVDKDHSLFFFVVNGSWNIVGYGNNFDTCEIEIYDGGNLIVPNIAKRDVDTGGLGDTGIYSVTYRTADRGNHSFMPKVKTLFLNNDNCGPKFNKGFSFSVIRVA